MRDKSKHIRTAVVIPVYKPLHEHTEGEQASLANTFKVLRQHSFVLIAPPGLDITAFKQLAHHCGVDLAEKRFEAHYFQGLHSYSDLLMNAGFYKSFKGFTHLLICQPDAWVFYDELETWCRLNYSFVGAPFFEGWNDDESFKFLGVGNGGFSLRKIADCRKVLARVHWMYVLRQTMGSKLFKQFRKAGVFNQIFGIRSQEHLMRFLNADTIHEDIAWGMWASEMFKDFYVPIPQQAMHFSFEMHPSYLYNLTKRKLPFGCHAWEKYEPVFWKEHISAARLEAPCSEGKP